MKADHYTIVMTKLAYLGPDGTFCSEAARRYKGEREGTLVDYDTIFDVMNAVIEHKADIGVVPLENSVEGSVTTTVDVFLQDNDLKIMQEIDLPIEHCLLAPPGVKIKDITDVLSHMQALAQCREFLRQRMPSVNHVPAKSTADAARRVAGVGPVIYDGQKHVFAAIGNKLTAKMYGLEILCESVQDSDANVTRFAVIGYEQLPPTGHDRTSIVFAAHRDRPGSLYEALGEFARRQINLSKIVSRPSKKVLGDYYFLVDLEGHPSDPKVAEAIAAIQEKSAFFKLLGAYPKYL